MSSNNLPVKITVERTVKRAREEESSEEHDDVLEVIEFKTQPAMAIAEIPVRMSKNFQSIGIKVGVQIPCYKEELDDAITEAIQMALDRVTSEIPELRNALDKLS